MSLIKLVITICIVIIGTEVSRSMPILEEQAREEMGSQENSAPGEERSEVQKQHGSRMMCVKWDKKGRCLYATVAEELPSPDHEVQSGEESGSGSGDDMILQDFGSRWYRCKKRNKKGLCIDWEYWGGIVPIWSRPGRR